MLVFVILMILLFVALASSATRAARRRREEREREMREFQEQQRQLGAGSSGSPTSPFAGMPFGSLFESLMSMGSARSFAYDPETGRWVDISHQDQMMQAEETEPAAAANAVSTPKARRERPKSSARRRSSGTANPLSGLLGGMDGGGNFLVEPADELITFEEVGGMEDLKTEVRDTIGLLLEHPEDAERFGIEWNGILLHGPPGVGKTFFARAIAGEYGLNLMHVSTGDLVSGVVGGSARNIDRAFETALGHLPCLLFFDEFDSVAQRRDNSPDQESRRTVNQLLTALERYRDERRLVVMAATNSIQHLDPAIIRPGRFDRHIRIDLPDGGARREIFVTELGDRPTTSDIDVDALVGRTEGMTPAAIEKVVEIAALAVFKRAKETGRDLKLTTEDLLSAVDRHGGQDRPTVEHWTWDSLILAPEIKAQLQQLQAVIEDPESARRFGVDPPTGLLLAGPPGTGKTTVAKVLAAQARCSFYPISGADVISKWVGESERNIRQVFERARANRPSIIFIDEIDAIASRRGGVETHDSHVNQLLAEIDGVAGQRGLFIIGATNRPDQLDPALLRGGRLSRTIVLGLPEEAERLAMLRMHSVRMPTVGVDLEELARGSEGMSPADLKALCQEAALAAMARTSDDGRADDAPPPAVTHEDFAEALGRLRSSKSANESSGIVSL